MSPGFVPGAGHHHAEVAFPLLSFLEHEGSHDLSRYSGKTFPLRLAALVVLSPACVSRISLLYKIPHLRLQQTMVTSFNRVLTVSSLPILVSRLVFAS